MQCMFIACNRMFNWHTQNVVLTWIDNLDTQLLRIILCVETALQEKKKNSYEPIRVHTLGKRYLYNIY